MKLLGAASIALLTLYAAAATATETDGSFGVPANSHLYLVSTGQLSSTGEMYLWTLCKLLRRTEGVATRFKFIGVYRHSPELSQIADDLLQDLATGKTDAAQDVLQLSEHLHRTDHVCTGTPDALGVETTRTESGPTALLWIEPLLESLEIRAELRVISPGARSDDKGILAQPPVYIQARQSAEDVARTLARRFLPLTASDVIAARTSLSISAPERCGPDLRHQRCVRLGHDLNLQVTVRDTAWLSASEAVVNVHTDCNAAVRQVASTYANQEKQYTFAIRPRSAGQCHVTGNVSAPDADLHVSLSHSFEALAPSLLFTADELGIRLADSRTYDLHQSRLWPFGRATRQGPSVRDRLGREVTRRDAADIVSFGNRVRSRLLEIGFGLGKEREPELVEVVRKDVDEFEISFGHRLLLVYGSRVDAYCERLETKLRETASRSGFDFTGPGAWLSKCTHAVWSEYFSLERASQPLGEVLLDLGDRRKITRLVDDAGWPDSSVSPATIGSNSILRVAERFSISALSDGRVQSEPLVVNTNLSQPTPNLGLGAFWGMGHTDRFGTNQGYGIGIELPMLHDTATVIGEAWENIPLKMAPTWEAGAIVHVNVGCALRVSSYLCEKWVIEGGYGYETINRSGVLSLRLGWRSRSNYGFSFPGVGREFRFSLHHTAGGDIGGGRAGFMTRLVATAFILP